MEPVLVIPNLVILFNPWSILLYKVWVVPAAPAVLTSVKPNPTEVSTTLFSIVSLVRDFCCSLIATCPILLGTAKDLDAGASDTGLSLLVWGYKLWIGCE